MTYTDRDFLEWFYKGEFTIALQDIVVLVVGIILLVSLMPSALSSFYTTNTANWSTAVCVPGTAGCNGANDTATFAIWRLFPLIGVLAAFLLIAIPVLRRI